MELLKVFTQVNLLLRKKSNTLPMISKKKKQLILVNYIYYLKLISGDNIPGRPVISNCGTPTETASEFLDF